MRAPSLERGLTRQAWLLGRRARWYLRHPTALARTAVVFLNVPPFTAAFRAIYTLGLRCAVARLARHGTIHSILGTGSYFRGTGLYGNSDIDLVIVFRREARRSDGVQYPVARTYNAVRRLFPFLGGWDEKEANLIFLDELADGFPPHSTFRIQMQRGEFVLLHGEPFPAELAGAPVSAADWVLEIDRLLRWAVITGEDFAERLLFWQRMFAKLQEAAESLNVRWALATGGVNADLAVLDQDQRTLFFRSARPDEMFALFLQRAHDVFHAVRTADEVVRLERRPFGGRPPSPRSIEIPDFAVVKSAVRARSLPSTPIGLQPRLFYFSVDEPMVMMDLEGGAYRGLRALLERIENVGERSDAVIARVDEFLFLFNREIDFVDVVPLDPLLCSNAYAWLEGDVEFSMPASVHRPSEAEAECLFAALRDAYRRHTGYLPKHSSPSIYREDDLDTMRDALDILRAYVGHAHRVSVADSGELVQHLSERYPGARDFLDALVEYRGFLLRDRRGRPPANNLYRCLHRFVAEVLEGAEEIEITDFNRRIGITVGIVTRNRARDLRNALESLTRQERVPDEVLIVDNGSTDDTKAVIAGFEGRLPLRYLYLGEASIPSARNMILEHSTQEIVSFTDDDCDIPREWLSSVERGFLRADNVGVVGGWVEHWPRSGGRCLTSTTRSFTATRREGQEFMIIELPILPSNRAAKRYQMSFFHFSNNNLSIRRDCARAIGGYDRDMRTSEDVEICFRVALSDRWVACREPGVVVRHKARRTLGGMIKQLWGWGINLGKAYRKTGKRGIYLYWVDPTKHTIAGDLEIDGFPLLVTGYFTAFHAAHLAALGAVVAAVTGMALVAAVLAVAATGLLLYAMHNVGGHGLGPWKSFHLAILAYLATVVFMAAAFLGAVRARIVYIPPAIFQQTTTSERFHYEEEPRTIPADGPREPGGALRGE